MRVLLFLLAIGFFGVCVVGLVGRLIVESVWRESERRYRHDSELAAPTLADPAYRRLLTTDFPSAGFCISGPVMTKAAYDRLRAEMTRLFGEERVDHIMADVWVEAKTETAPAPRGIDSMR